MDNLQLFIAFIVGLISTIMVKLPNETNKIIISIILVLSVHYILNPKQYILALLFTIYAILLVYIWNYLNVIEFPGYKNIPLWLPFIFYSCITCLLM